MDHIITNLDTIYGIQRFNYFINTSIEHNKNAGYDWNVVIHLNCLKYIRPSQRETLHRGHVTCGAILLIS